MTGSLKLSLSSTDSPTRSAALWLSESSSLAVGLTWSSNRLSPATEVALPARSVTVSQAL